MDKVAWFKIIEKDLIEWLQNYDGERYHAILADPPYALISVTKRFGKEDSAPTQEGTDGLYSRLSSGFMGQTWDGFESLEHYREWIKTWAKLLIEKALYPGAVCLFFGGTRTWHHLALGLEQGGFEIYDTLLWLYGTGFPKSHSLEKYIKDDTWQGYGTALKPAWEPILLCRVPRNGATFASLALEHRSGALNINGTRIGHNEQREIMKPRSSQYGKTVYAKAWPGQERDGESLASPHPKGRWPANFLLSHHEDCQKIGTFEVPARIINRWLEGMKPFGDGAGGKYETIHPSREGEPSADKTYEDEGSTNFAMKPGPRRDKEMETVEHWACVPECPIKQLDDRAGVSTSGRMKRYVDGYPSEGATVFIEGRSGPDNQHGGRGGPSRFFYCGKASRAEKDKGLEEYYWKRTGKGFERVDQATWANLERRERARGCIHPTVKPLDICRYLATLILPPKQKDKIRRILIPFSGSGSEIIAAKQAGWDFIVGIETSSIYNDIARTRISASIGMF